MPQQSAYDEDFPDDVIIESAVVYHKPSTTRVILGMFRGGVSFAAADEVRVMQADGVPHEVQGMARFNKRSASVSGTLVQLGAAQLALLEPGSTSTTASSGPAIVTTTPKAAGVRFADDDYVKELEVAWLCDNGDTFSVIFDLARSTKPVNFKSADGDEGTCDAEFVAVLPKSVAAVNTRACPYRYVRTPKAA